MKLKNKRYLPSLYYIIARSNEFVTSLQYPTKIYLLFKKELFISYSFCVDILDKKIMQPLSLKQDIRLRRSARLMPSLRLLPHTRPQASKRKKQVYPRHLFVLAPKALRLTNLLKAALRPRNNKIIVLGFLLGLGLVSLLLLGASRSTFVCPELPPVPSVLEDFWLASQHQVSNQKDSELKGSQFPQLVVTDYRLKSGEGLLELAKNKGLNVDTIISFNNISDASRLKAGMVLKLPNRNGLLHYVRAGDSLSKLSRKYKVSLNEILDWNNLAHSSLKVGQKLFIPNARLSANEVNKVLGCLFVWPTVGNITSFFGMRLSPISGQEMFHGAIDIANWPDTKIRAAMSGKVLMVDYNRTYGNFIIIAHSDGFQTLYAHLEKVFVKRGQVVGQGETIGLMGNTGSSTGSHLHFAIFKNGKPVDPLLYLK